MIELLTEPIILPFMQDAFFMAILVAIPTALLSCFVVLKGWSLMGDAVSHSVLPGIVLAYLAGIPLILGAFASGLACALGAGYLANGTKLKPDTVLGVVFAGMLGLGLVMFSKVQTGIHLDHILYGNILGLERSDLLISGLVALLVTLVIALRWKDLMLQAFDPAQAQTQGMPIGLMHYGLLTLLSLTLVSVLSAVGLILAIGLVIAPGAIALLLTKRFGLILVLAPLISVLAAVIGVYSSYWLDSAPAPTVILVLMAGFLLAFAWAKLRRV